MYCLPYTENCMKKHFWEGWKNIYWRESIFFSSVRIRFFCWCTIWNYRCEQSHLRETIFLGIMGTCIFTMFTRMTMQLHAIHVLHWLLHTTDKLNYQVCNSFITQLNLTFKYALLSDNFQWFILACHCHYIDSFKVVLIFSQCNFKWT